MREPAILGGTIHRMPTDLRRALNNSSEASAVWQSLTPLARNEWICWNISVKKAHTRNNHIKRTIRELQDGKRRPCCWIGCIHRKDKTLSPSVRWALTKS